MGERGDDRERGSDAIGPTAHYTAHVWARNGMSHPSLATTTGRLLFDATQPWMIASRALGGVTLEEFLLARHRLIDHLLERAIEEGGVSQVLEIACGLSPRGWRFATRHGASLTYVEADLPAMAERKREALATAGTLGPHHRVVDIDAVADGGPLSLASVAAELDAGGGTAVITEGLLSYLSPADVADLWRRIAAALGRFPDGVYLSDLHLSSEESSPLAGPFRVLLSGFVRGRVNVHFETASDAERALVQAGFGEAALHRPADFAGRIDVFGKGAEVVRVLEARRRS
jgi:O-methyltransferase involved in polyketide biosynthesis